MAFSTMYTKSKHPKSIDIGMESDQAQAHLVHVLLVSFPAQGHVNPLFRLGKALANKGLLVTFTTTEFIGKQMRKANNLTDHPTRIGNGYIRFEFFEDGWEEEEPKRQNLDVYLPQLQLVGEEFIAQMVKKYSEEGRPVSCLITNPFFSWVSDVAENLSLSSAMLWNNSCACFLAYYYYFHGLVPFPSESEPKIDVKIPGMPVLRWDELPSFLHPFTPAPFLKRAMLGGYRNLEKPFCILMDSFDELEKEAIQQASKLCNVKAVGPLFRNMQAKEEIRGDFMKADDCIGWLDSKPVSSVVYVTFGSVVALKQEQVDEIAYGLLNSGVSFLWVLKQPHKHSLSVPVCLPDGFLDKVTGKGKVVQWCPQEEVLTHPSVSCIMMHCGWNSSVELLASGVPVICFPQWGDQVTEAKLLVDVFKVGVRVCRGETDNKIITRQEMEKCFLHATTGPKAVELKENALKWKKAAEEAVAAGGSSKRNLQEFVDQVIEKCVQTYPSPAKSDSLGLKS